MSSEKYNEIEPFLNGGYKRGQKVGISVPNGRDWKAIEIEPFLP